eukprot:jgi/Chlat1/8778/Chrsp90S08128
MDAMRKQLDALMGSNRNGDVQEEEKKYFDRGVCRFFLCGLCPHDLFNNTKMDLGDCPNVHNMQLRRDYEDARAKRKDNYDRELEMELEKLVVDCDRKITRAQRRLEDDDTNAKSYPLVSTSTICPEADELTEQIKKKQREADDFLLEGRNDDNIRLTEELEVLIQQRADAQAKALLQVFHQDHAHAGTATAAPPPPGPTPVPDEKTQQLIKEKLQLAEELGEQGRVDEAKAATDEAEALKRAALAPPPPTSVTKTDARILQADQKLRVCDICGAFLSIYDSDRRLADHFGGKLHLGYLMIRDKLQELRKPKTATPVDNEVQPEKERSYSRDRDNGDRDRERDKGDRDRERDRDRDHHRDRDRGRDRHHDRDRRDHYRDSRGRDHSSRDRRERSRSRERYDRHRDDYRRDRR